MDTDEPVSTTAASSTTPAASIPAAVPSMPLNPLQAGAAAANAALAAAGKMPVAASASSLASAPILASATGSITAIMNNPTVSAALSNPLLAAGTASSASSPMLQLSQAQLAQQQQLLMRQAMQAKLLQEQQVCFSVFHIFTLKRLTRLKTDNQFLDTFYISIFLCMLCSRLFVFLFHLRQFTQSIRSENWCTHHHRLETLCQ